MTGSLQTQNGKYYMVINLYENGKRKPKWINTDLPIKGNKRAAQQKLNEYLANGEKTEALFKRKNISAQGLAFLTYMEQWLESRKGSIEESTYAAYDGMIKGKLTTFFGSENPKLADFSPQHLEDFYRWMRSEKLTGNTLVHYHACIRKALNHAFKTGLVLENIADKVDRPKKDKYIASYYDKGELDVLFKKSKGDALELVIYVTAFYGLRRSETLGLKWDAIDFQNKTVTIRHKVTDAIVDGKLTVIAKDKLKTKASNRTLPLLPQIEERLLAEKERQKQNKKLCKKSYQQSEYIFVNDLGNPIKPDFVSAHFKYFIEKNGLRKIRFHDLRHANVKPATKNNLRFFVDSSIPQIVLFMRQVRSDKSNPLSYFHITRLHVRYLRSESIRWPQSLVSSI